MRQLFELLFGPDCYVLLRKDGSEHNTIIAGSWPKDTLVVESDGIIFVKTNERSYYNYPVFREEAHTCHYRSNGN